METPSLGWTKKVIIMDDAHDSYESETNAMGENIQVHNEEIESNGRIIQVNPLGIAKTTRILRVELQSCRVDNERTIRDQEEYKQFDRDSKEYQI